MKGDMLSVQGSWMNFIPSKAARQYALECVDCSSTDDDISAADFTESHESVFQDFSGAIKYYHDLGDSTDIAFGLTGGMFSTDTNRFSPLYGLDGEIGTPYGTVDSSSTGIGATNKDSANFLTGDFEYGWRNSGGSMNTRLFIGARSEMLNWKRTAMQDLSSSNSYAGTEKSEFLGIGPRIGGSFDMPLGSSESFGLFGGLSGGVMVGSLEQKFNLDSSSTAYGDIDDYSKAVAVPFADVEMGVSAHLTEGITFQFGYQAGFASGILRTATVCTDDDVDDVKPYNDSCGDERSDVLTHGAFIRLSGNF